MTGTVDRRSLSPRRAVVALLAVAALSAAVVGRVTGCEGCDVDVLGVPLYAAGSVFYLALGLMALVGLDLKIVGWASLPGVAIQAGLVRHLGELGAPCWTCLAAAACLFALSVACLWPHRFQRTAVGVAGLTGLLTLPLWGHILAPSERVSGLPPFARAQDLAAAPEGAALLVIYERDGCAYCGAFDRDYWPRLTREFGNALFVRRLGVQGRTGVKRVPSFLLRAPDGSLTLIRGLPTYDDLAATIRAVTPGR